MRGIANYVDTHGPWLLLLDPLADSSYPKGRSENWRGDGILTYVQDRPRALRLRRRGIPTVELFGYRDDNILPLVSHDDLAIGRLAAGHLIERNFRHLAFCGYRQASWSDRRRLGFVEHATAAKCPSPNCLSFERRQRFVDRERMEEELVRWLKELPKPVGLMACSDNLAQAILDACLRAKLAVPNTVAVIGVNNDEEICRLSNPSLSSVILNSERVGFEGARLLDKLMRRRIKPDGISPLLFAPLGVATRRSTEATAVQDRLIADAMRLIQERACHGLSADDLLQHFRISRSTFYDRFHEALGRSPSHEILRVRLDRAKSLLSQTLLPLKRIAEQVGFDDPNYLHAAFKREVGVNPGEYRLQHSSR
jgi:LacI family transcriptional regulator